MILIVVAIPEVEPLFLGHTRGAGVTNSPLSKSTGFIPRLFQNARHGIAPLAVGKSPLFDWLIL